MRCPYCAHVETQVVETRESDEGDVVRRRRRCTKCDKRFTTYERAEIALPAIVKRSGARVEFEPAKLRSSMTLALRKRQVSIEQVDAAIERIQDKLLASGAREVPSTRIGELVMRELAFSIGLLQALKRVVISLMSPRILGCSVKDWGRGLFLIV